ncbi:unnamed protein product, partial [Hapterophycus canaliculatus]
KANPRKRFFHCYLLQSQDPKHKRSTYIGFTVDPGRRIRQHNGGINGGAYRTKRKRPWDMVAIVHGFPSKSSALQFEQAWQHPQRSRHIKSKVRDLPVDSRRTVGVPGKLRLCKAMLCLDPWARYGLGVRFLREEYATSYSNLRLPSPLPPNGDADTDLSTGAQAGLPMYSGPLPGSQEEQLEALRRQPGGRKYGVGGEDIVGDPPVWRVDDSSSDDGDDDDVEEEQEGGDGDDQGSDGSKEGWRSGAASRDLVSQTEPDEEEGKEEDEDDDDDDDDDFWRLSNGSNRRSQARHAGVDSVDSGQRRRMPPCAERSGKGGCSGASPALTGDPMACVSLVDAISETHDSDCWSVGDEQDASQKISSPKVPLAERLRLRSLRER